MDLRRCRRRALSSAFAIGFLVALGAPAATASGPAPYPTPGPTAGRTAGPTAGPTGPGRGLGAAAHGHDADRPDPGAEVQRPSRRTPLSVPTEQPGRVVYLTFDDGPSASGTPQVLALLAEYGAQATFFMVGSQAQAAPDLVAQVRAAGHAVGNHTYHHPWLTNLSDSGIGQEITSTSRAVRGTSCLRPPGGFVDARVRSVAASLGQSLVMWTVDPQDWRRPGAAAIAGAVLDRATSGSIVLLHDGGRDRSQTVAALRTILATLSARGDVFRTLPQCE